MGVVGRLQEAWYRGTGRAELAETLREQREVLRAEQETNALLMESIADLENRMYDPGWQRFTALAEQEFTRDGLRQITAVCRVMALKNPLIKRGLSLRQSYVWGQGVEITARDQAVNDVIQDFMDDAGNRRSFTGQQAREEAERAAGTDGNVFFACFTSPRTGRVQVRVLPWDEITDVVTNPDDASEPWFYRREWWAERRDPASGGIIQSPQVAYYPALGYRPTARPRRVNFAGTGDNALVDVYWDAPVYHVKVGGLLGWKYGVPDCYAAVDWARGYKDFLSDWATLIKALSRFAWRLTSKGSKQAAARTKLAARPATDPATGEERHAGATALLTPDMALEAVPKSGATIDSESGRPLAAMVAAALDLPVTMLLGDPGVTGARATAETLDAPTERAMQSRRAVWGDAIRAVLTHVICEAVRAPQGALQGRIVRDEFGRETAVLDDDSDQTVDISWPDLDDVDVGTVIEAIVKADGTGHLPEQVIARLLLEALGVKHVDEIIGSLTDENGDWVPPSVGAGQAAAAAFRRGQDPAALLSGTPNDDDGPAETAEALAGTGA